MSAPSGPRPGIPVTRRAVVAGLAALCAAPAAADPGIRHASSLIVAARCQVGQTLRYDPAYTALPFPGGDVPRGKGVCTDVLIRAYRDAFGLDLQALVNADMRRAFAAYPRNWGLKGPDRNIDHRRVPNLQAFFLRQHARLPVPRDPAGWQPGDIFTSLIGGRLPHTGIVSDRGGGSRAGYVIHNIGNGTREEAALFDHPLTGRYRWALSG
ncbi:DUF1287 domain-containing protein [Sphingomonas xinjiangensis]|uniref:DUF1287 domain-containing protein n=1 Tax=Sphingomonas xinjiangensis TaxID=643568 RepID=A0A840YB81_9SPHN|nr:DUF1287 domain-containing protein [Sphingomonas xinjiangensis]MBB5710597.1 hypothetical protein [Sphingomonas xinjiangensis]